MMHPVHISGQRKMSPSAFIPFCEFGGDMARMGVKIPQFDVPVCNSFQARTLNDQLCYEVDLKKISNKDNIEHELKLGFIFFMDYNEDRQVTFNNQYIQKEKNKSFGRKIVQSDENQHAFIYLDSIGTIFDNINDEFYKNNDLFRTSETTWPGRVQHGRC